MSDDPNTIRLLPRYDAWGNRISGFSYSEHIGTQYTRADIHRAEVEAAVKRALEAVMTRLQNVELPVEVADDTFDAGWFWMLGEAQAIAAAILARAAEVEAEE